MAHGTISVRRDYFIFNPTFSKEGLQAKKKRIAKEAILVLIIYYRPTSASSLRDVRFTTFTTFINGLTFVVGLKIYENDGFRIPVRCQRSVWNVSVHCPSKFKLVNDEIGTDCRFDI